MTLATNVFAAMRNLFSPHHPPVRPDGSGA